MNTKILYLFLLISLITTSACENFYTPENLNIEQDFKTINIINSTTIKLPKYLNKKPLQMVTTIQYENAEKEVYTRITHSTKNEFITLYTQNNAYDASKSILENYKTAQLNVLKSNIKDQSHLTNKTAIIDNMPSEIMECEGKLIDIDIYYHVTFIEGKENLYYIHSWTTLSKKSKYQETFHQIATSLIQH